MPSLLDRHESLGPATPAEPTKLVSSLAEAYQQLATDRAVRAERVRRRADNLDSALEPLRSAMKRRAAELELSSAALIATSEGQQGL